MQIVNPHRIRLSIKRIFPGGAEGMRVILGELLQNSQRAQANDVTITTTDDQLIYEDNGQGLYHPEAFFTLLAMGESGFDSSETLEAQHPMGLGIHAALAHPDIHRVVFESHTRRIDIDTGPWWDDPAYYLEIFARAKQDLLDDAETPIAGMRVILYGTPACITQARNALTKQDSMPGQSYSHVQRYPVVAGYVGWLTITLNGAVLDTAVPTYKQAPLFTSTYQNSTLRVYLAQSGVPNIVVWYGQRIDIPKGISALTAFRWVLEVREGRPLNPRAPVRDSIIDDAAYQAFLTHVEDEIHTWYAAKAAALSATAELREYYRWGQPFAVYADAFRRKFEALKVVVAREIDWVKFDPWESTDHYGLEIAEQRAVFPADATPLMLNTAVWISMDQSNDAEQGLGSFQTDLEPLLPTLGHRIPGMWHTQFGTPAEEFTLWWEPGPAQVSHDRWSKSLRGRGRMWLESDSRTSAVVPVTADVIAVSWGADEDVGAARWVGGVDDPVAFLQGDLPWFAWDSEGCTEDDHDDFDDSITAVIRALRENCVPWDFTRLDLQRYVLYPKAVECIWKDGTLTHIDVLGVNTPDLLPRSLTELSQQGLLTITRLELY
jgi:hypothetical protein